MAQFLDLEKRNAEKRIRKLAVLQKISDMEFGHCNQMRNIVSF